MPLTIKLNETSAPYIEASMEAKHTLESILLSQECKNSSDLRLVNSILSKYADICDKIGTTYSYAVYQFYHNSL